MKRLAVFILILSLVSISCRTLTNLRAPTDEPTVPFIPGNTTEPSTSVPSTSEPSNDSSDVKIEDMAQRLEELGAERCDANPDFTCLTIAVPLNHFDPNNTETIDVVFAVSPAEGERYGMYVQAFPGGPGGEGITYASTFYFRPASWNTMTSFSLTSAAWGSPTHWNVKLPTPNISLDI